MVRWHLQVRPLTATSSWIEQCPIEALDIITSAFIVYAVNLRGPTVLFLFVSSLQSQQTRGVGVLQKAGGNNTGKTGRKT